MHVDFWDSTGDKKPRVTAVIRMVNGQLQIDGTMPPSMRTLIEERLDWIRKRGKSDEEFLLTLDMEFAGASYYNVQVIQD